MSTFIQAAARACAACVALSCLLLASAMAADTWPTLALPGAVKAYPIGDQVTVNGMPMRMRGFVARTSVDELADWFRKSMGKPLAENMVGPKLVLGRRQGDYFLTVQLEPMEGGGGGTRGTVAVTNLRQTLERRDDTRATRERLLARLPSGSRLLSQMNSTDRGKLSTYLLAENGHSEELNRDSVIEFLREDGLAFEREARRDAKTMYAGPAPAMGGRTLFFKGSNKEAMAVIRQGDNGRTTIVLNTINHMEHLK